MNRRKKPCLTNASSIDLCGPPSRTTNNDRLQDIPVSNNASPTANPILRSRGRVLDQLYLITTSNANKAGRALRG
jgi:hypothetical protein